MKTTRTEVYEYSVKFFKDFSDLISSTEKAKVWEKTSAYMLSVGFLEAPASSKYHLSVYGGLLVHSVSVARVGLTLNKILFGSRFSQLDIVSASLLHDIAKAGIIYKGKHYPLYVEKETQTGYHYKDLPIRFSVRDLSPIITAKLGWSDEIIQAVLLHDGAYVQANLDYSHKIEPFTLLITLSDTFSAQYLETQDDVNWEDLDRFDKSFLKL